MRKTIQVLAVCMFLATSAIAQSGDVSVKADKFTGKTTVALKKSITLTETGFTNLYLGLSSDDPSGAVVYIYSWSNGWRFLQGADVYVLADGERIDLGHFKSIRADVRYGSTVDETIAGVVDRDVIRRIAQAKDLEMKIGPTAVKLKDKKIEHIRAFAAALPAVQSVSK